MELESGKRLGPYEILARIGAGGMGTVYRARDTRLDRSVAVKVLSAQGAADPQMRERLAREARAVSALSHPNICALYDVGSDDGMDYLVMELLDGDSLAQRIARGPLPLPQALRIAREIALALDAAHRAGLVHRDLKPGNVMLTRNGARLLDFGLAKAFRSSADSEETTMHTPLTREGAIVGTLRYMAPEQLEGAEVDSRSDIFAFGVLLYEMVSGRPAFNASSQASLATAILTQQPPPLRTINAEVPPVLERIVVRCLQKDPDDRWQSARDLADALQWSGEESGTAPLVAQPKRKSFVVPALAVIALLLAGALVWSMLRPTKTTDGPELRFAIMPPPGTTFAQRPVASELALSPDGRSIAMIVADGQRRQLVLRRLDSLAVDVVAGTDGAYSPFWSPDGKWIGFFAGAELKKVPAAGGATQTICPAKGAGASWSADGKILFFEWGPGTTEAMEVVSDTGGEVRHVVESDGGWCTWPEFLSDNKHFIFFWLRPSNSGLYVASLDGGKPKMLVDVRSRGVVRGDNLYYIRDSILVRQKLDLERLTTSGDAVKVADKAFLFAGIGSANFTVAETVNVVAYQRAALPTQLVWRDLNGRELSRVGKPELYRKFHLSPEGKRVVFDLIDPRTQMSDIWISDLERSVNTRVTTDLISAFAPIWTSSGDSLLYSASEAKQVTSAPQLALLTLADGALRPLIRHDGPNYATDVTADGGTVIYTVVRGRESMLEMRSIAGGSPVALGSRRGFDERDGTLSPDERWLAFQSTESGEPAIYVMPFRRPGEKIRVSTSAGSEPRWGHDGKSLYFIAEDGMLTRADVETGAMFRVLRETNLFRISSAGMIEFEGFGLCHYQLDRDRVLVREIPSGVDDQPVTVIVNGP